MARVKSPPKTPPTLVGVPTRTGHKPATTSPSSRTKNRRSKGGRVKSHVPKSRHDKPSQAKASTSGSASSLAPISYNKGPFPVEIKDYDWRVWLIRGDDSDRVLLSEDTEVTWDDSSAVMTGSITFETPDWASKLGTKEGHEIRLDYSEDSGGNWTSLWTQRILAPNHDLATQARTANLVNDLNRLAQSDDDFVFTAGKARPGGWRVDEVIRFIADAYDFTVGYCPVISTKIKNWHLTDQHPLDVIHSALLRERHATGRKYAISLDAQKRIHVTPFRRPLKLFQVGPALLAAVASATHDPRFATAVTVRSDGPDTTAKDKQGHRKVTHNKIAADVQSDAGVDLYGFIHRNLYSPDANNSTDAAKEGKLFLHAIAKPKRSFQVTVPGMPFIRRLDAIKAVFPKDGISQIVYVQEARHTLSGTSGYTTELTLAFDDPFVDQNEAKILAKLTDVATSRARKTTAKAKTKPKPKNAKAHSAATSKKKKTPSLVGVVTRPGRVAPPQPVPPRTAKRK